MLNATIWNKHRDTTAEYKDVRLSHAGVILSVIVQGTLTEVLIPWHRIHDVYGSNPGEIALELGQ